MHTVWPGFVETPGFPQRGRFRGARYRIVATPELVAQRILTAVEHDRREVVVPGWYRPAAWAQALTPALLARVTAAALVAAVAAESALETREQVARDEAGLVRREPRGEPGGRPRLLPPRGAARGPWRGTPRSRRRARRRSPPSQGTEGRRSPRVHPREPTPRACRRP